MYPRRLLVLGSRLEPSAADRSEIRELAGTPGLDWAAVLDDARQEGVAALLYRTLRDELIPEEIRDELKKFYVLNSLRVETFLAGLSGVLRGAAEERLRVVLTKGGRLMESVYGDPGLRPVADLDLLVHPSDWRAFRKILEARGFVDASPLPVDPEHSRLRWMFSPYFRRDRVYLEIHFAALGFHLPLADEPALWAATRVRSVHGVEARVLAPEHELAYLCAHALQHSFSRLIWLVDIAEFCRREKIDGNALIAFCRREGLAAPVHHAFTLVNRLWPGAVPDRWIGALTPGRLERFLLRTLWPEEKIAAREGLPSHPFYSPTLFAIMETRRVVPALKGLANIFFPPAAWVSFTYNIPNRVGPLLRHYAWRLSWPLRLLRGR